MTPVCMMRVCVSVCECGVCVMWMVISNVIILFKKLIPCYHLTTKIEQRDTGGGREEREREKDKERDRESRRKRPLALPYTSPTS